jgi:hypothetical protein
MAYPQLTAPSLQYKHPELDPLNDYSCYEIADGVELSWNTQTMAKPSESEISAWIAEPEFSNWYTTHGGDTTLTARQLALDAVSQELRREYMIDRAIAMVVIDEINSIRQWIMDFKAATAAAASLADFKTKVAALNDMPQRTGAQARAAINNKLSSGSVDS